MHDKHHGGAFHTLNMHTCVISIAFVTMVNTLTIAALMYASCTDLEQDFNYKYPCTIKVIIYL